MEQSKRWTVSDLTRYVRELFEMDYRLQDVEVEGEVSDFRVPGSGHAYFTLKDAGAQLRCVMWRSEVQQLGALPRQGDRVIAQGYLSVYDAAGQYQLYCRTLQPAGAGDLHARFEELKQRLQAEGLFDPARKRPLPTLPRTIGIATSPSTAALQDVLNILGRRYPLARVVLAETPVQGEQAPPQIVEALSALNAQPDIDVILLVRGGGSLEDLWCFNDERVARAVAGSRIPVISGVGHEIDFTLADFAADLRAPTPSAAAELVTRVTRDDLLAEFQAARVRLAGAAGSDLMARRAAVERLAQAVARHTPRTRIDSARQTLDMLISRGERAVDNSLELQRSRLRGLRRALQAISPYDTLARGYAIVQGPDGKALHSATDVSIGDTLNIRLHKGRLSATVNNQEVEDE